MVDRVTQSWIRNPSDTLAVANGCTFSVLRGSHTVWWIERFCRLYEGASGPLRLRGCHQCGDYGLPDLTIDSEWDEFSQSVMVERAKLFSKCVKLGHRIDWQYDCTMRVFGWEKRSDRLGRMIRRFRESTIFIGKKNKKSPSLAAWANYMLIGDGELGQKVYLWAKDGSQARDIAGGHVIKMVEKSEELDDECVINKSTMRVTHLASDSWLQPMSSANEATQKSKEGANGSSFVDECFIAGTQICTPSGLVPIDKVNPGDKIYHAFGIGKVVATTKKHTVHIVKMEFSDGSSIYCTPGHPIFTWRGWIKAGELAVGEVAFRREDMQELLEGVSSSQMEEQGWENLRADRESLERAGLLLAFLRQESEEPNEATGECSQGFRNIEEDWSQTTCSRRQRYDADETADCVASHSRGGLDAGVGNHNWVGKEGGWLSRLIQSGYWERDGKDRDRGRREIAQHERPSFAGSEENGVFKQPRLVRISRIQRTSPCAVFNLHVSGHPSYFANGKLVHNCHVVDRKLIKRISRAGISRDEPLHAEFSTSGDDPDSYGKERFDFAVAVESGEKENQGLFAAVYAAPQNLSDADLDDDPLKYARMANPALGHTVDPDEFMHDYEQSKGRPADLATFKMYRLNIWQNASSPWLDQMKWRAGSRTIALAEYYGRDCWAALDLASVKDFAALTLCFPEEDGSFTFFWWFWLPEETRRAYRDLIPIDAWLNDDRCNLVLTPGARIDYGYITSTFRDLSEQFSIQQLLYDDWNAEKTTQEISEGIRDNKGVQVLPGTGIERINFSQGIKAMNEPTKRFEALVLDEKCLHNGDPLAAWMAGNAAIKPDQNGNYKPIKPKDGVKKIDGIITAVMAYAGAESGMAAKQTGKYYETHELEMS